MIWIHTQNQSNPFSPSISLMASSAKILCFLLCFFISSSQIYARESQLFSKFSSPHNTNTNTNMPQDTQETNINSDSNNNMLQDAQELDATAKPEEEPAFTRANNNGYGLYGSSNTDQESRSTFSNNPTEEYNGGGNSEYMFNNGVPYNTNNNGHETKQYGNGMSDTRYQDNVNNNNNNNNNNNYGYEARQKSLYGHYKNNQYPVQKQGMSDTRFLENGKYFYDLNNEEMYQNQYQPTRRRNDVFGYSGSRGVNSRNQYNHEGADENLNSRNQYNHEGADENLYKFNNYMDNNQENQGGYVP